jgi:2-keto-3-deoxy-6-phosphogluconate aldolase
MDAYFAAGAALVGVGNDILDRKALEAGDDTRATAHARRYLRPAAHPGAGAVP